MGWSKVEQRLSERKKIESKSSLWFLHLQEMLRRVYRNTHNFCDKASLYEEIRNDLMRGEFN